MNTPLPTPPHRSPAVIQQVALIMLALCLLVPGALYLGAGRSTERVHEPVETRAAMDVLLAAINPASGPLAAPASSTPDAAALARLLPQCSGLPAHQGLPVMDDLAEQLHLLDQQLERLTAIPGVRNAPLRQRYRLDVSAWAQAISGGNVACPQAARSLRLLAGPDGATLLVQAQWREFRTPAGQRQATAAVQLATNSLAQTDPWRGWPGCIWLGGIEPGTAAYYLAPQGRATWGRPVCEQPGLMPAGASGAAPARALTTTAPASADDPAWAIPNDLNALIGELDALRLPQGRLYQDYVDRLPARANRRTVGRNEVDLGFNVQLTIDPRTQGIAQRVAACYTGQAAACAQAGIPFDRVGAAQGRGAASMWERAATRVTAVAVIDVASGRIEALASAHTPCYAQENDGPARDAGCPPLWTEPRRRPDALLNHAVFGDFQPGSTIKPILASVFFEDAASNPDQLRAWLASSNTDRFHDELFCVNAGGGRACDRLARVQQRAADLGWNSDCSAQPSRRCARGDILFGRRLSARLDTAEGAGDTLPDAPPLQRSALVGRLFVAPVDGGSNSGERLMQLPAVNRGAALSCRDAAGVWHASNCNSVAFKPLINEAAGQGQARTTALGLATMLARLAGAANGLPALRPPHLVERITDATGAAVATAATRSAGTASAPLQPLVQAEPTVVRADVAQQVLAGMARGTAAAGTGHLVCRHVFGDRCATLGQQVAGKTGTPSFGFDLLTLTAARQRCRANPRDEDCQQKPVKLYVAAVRSGAAKGAGHDKVIAVISERNWYLADRKLGPAQRDRVHGATNDLDNVSAEIAMRIVASAWVAPAPRR